MENLNAEVIKKALKCCTPVTTQKINCSTCPMLGTLNCMTMIKKNALALIESQEKRIKELAEQNARVNAAWTEVADDNERLHASCTERASVQEENERLERICESYALQYGTATDKEVLLKKERANTVRKMQFMIKNSCIDGGIFPAFVERTIDKVANELIEGGG